MYSYSYVPIKQNILFNYILTLVNILYILQILFVYSICTLGGELREGGRRAITMRMRSRLNLLMLHSGARTGIFRHKFHDIRRRICAPPNISHPQRSNTLYPCKTGTCRTTFVFNREEQISRGGDKGRSQILVLRNHGPRYRRRRVRSFFQND